ncbi:GMC oxidoreductase 9 [Mycena venus]|uniref:GMC oxidoreductase 9 n=1 Tax=Mycena venus TaxID=2733690 RepID=A0A8H7D506_9AGAR|nr:GMC oxidoreductase 9 [Mycena venus]
MHSSLSSFSAAVAIASRQLSAHPYLLFLGAAILLYYRRIRLSQAAPLFTKDLRKGIETDQYDVVIIGGGTAGCVLASRLSEDPSLSVCLLEAGESSLSLPHSRIPSGYAKLFGSERVFNLNTTPQPYAANNSRYWPRGKMLGGCSTINAQIFHCGSPSDYDEWARTGLEGASDWSYVNFRKYFLRFEKFSPSTSHRDVDDSARGMTGPVDTGFFGHFSSITTKFITACQNAGMALKSDLNTPDGTLGVAKVSDLVTYIDAKGRRVTTESAYLTRQVLSRSNLTVVAHASVTRLVFEKASSREGLRVSAVEVSPDEGVSFTVIRARKEVVLSAGAIHTPQILMLSGLGPAEQLRKHDITVVQDLPGVGTHLMDHPVVDVVLEETSGDSLSFFQPRTGFQTAQLIFALGRYSITGRGPLSTNFAEAAAFFRSSDPSLFPPDVYPAVIEDTTSGADAPDLEFFVSPLGYLKHAQTRLPNRKSLGLHIVLLRPQSLGTITLNSSNPFDPPVIDPKYLSSPNDMQILLRGMHMLNRIAKTAPLANIINHGNRDALFGHRLANASDTVLSEYIRTTLESLYHPTSTARMGLRADGGVVDAYLRVHGVENLRIVDASIFPTIPSGHTAAPTIAVAEKAAELIKASLQI